MGPTTSQIATQQTEGVPVTRVNPITRFSVEHPWSVVTLVVFSTLVFAVQFPKIRIDTDPKHMLPITSPVRQYNDQVERDFALHADVIVLGIFNDQGIFNSKSLSQIATLTREIEALPGVITRDVVSLSSTDNIIAQNDALVVRPALDRIPESDADLAAVRRNILGNPLFVNRIVSGDGTTTAIYVPIEPTANGKQIADKIRKLLPQDRAGDRFYLAGDPVARDTFGAEMFRQMAVFAPLAGVLMCVALWFMFRNAWLIVANMAVAMASIVWSMGLLIGLGYPVHIMSSMSPIFLMAIATDSVHVFNEFAFRMRESKDKRQAVLATIAAVGRPVFYSDICTAVGFAALATATIVPVKIFGLVVAFGTLVILLTSFTLVPAVLMLVRADRFLTAAPGGHDQHSWLSTLGRFCVQHAKAVTATGVVLLAIATIGLFRIRVNNNMVHWFKRGSEVRTADQVLSTHLGGTSTAYLVVQASADEAIKDPAMLRGIEGLQREVEKDPYVGKTFSVVDYTKRINFVLHDNNPAFDRIPASRPLVGQYLFLFGMSAKPSDLDNVVDYPFRRANVIVQLKSWNAGATTDFINRAKAYLAAHPLPGGATIRPAGIAYFNLVWSDEVLWGMVKSFLAGLVVVFFLAVALVRSVRWGILSFLPLLLTIAVIYGVVGLIGKDFDMPVAVLSTLSLGLAIDFAIHFVVRFRQRYREQPQIQAALLWTAARPGRGIILNAILFALGFAVMIFADVTPYITVGTFMMAIMLLSAITSIMYLTSLIHLFHPILLKGGRK
jgi:predicted RND superfamily exporter protein